jgi:rhomboid protease GluP
MSLSGVAIEPASEPSPEGLVPVGDYPTMAEGSEHGLVILAMGLPYWLIPADQHFVLLIERGAEAAAREQLTRFDRESVGWPPAPVAPDVAVRGAPLFAPLLWGLSILISFRAQQRWPAWTDGGSLDAVALFERGEWWRPGTALFLHGDLGHLVSNVVTGVFVFSAVLSTFGACRGWLWLALAACGGNLASAALHYPAPYSSVGASTAIFAGLGLLTGRALGWAGSHPGFHRWRGTLVPLSAGAILLALYGAGGPQVDFGAHICGFAAGLAGGSVAGIFRSRPARD